MKITKFYTSSCGQCKVVDHLLKKADIDFASVDCTQDQADVTWLMKKYMIQHVPTVIVEEDDGSYKKLANIAEVKQWLAHNH